MKTDFQTVVSKTVIKGVCEKCGKNRQRTIVSMQTVNPWNKNSQGLPKSRDEVNASVNKNLKLLVKRFREKFICKSCENKLPWGEKWFSLSETEYIESTINWDSVDKAVENTELNKE